MQVSDSGCDGLQDAGQGKDHRDVDAAAHRHRRQIVGSVVAKQHGIDDHHAHRCQLGEKHRRRMREDLADRLGEHGAVVAIEGRSGCPIFVAGGQVSVPQACLSPLLRACHAARALDRCPPM